MTGWPGLTIWLIPAVPLLGAGLCLLWTRTGLRRAAPWTAITAVFISFLSGIGAYLSLNTASGPSPEVVLDLWNWALLDSLEIQFGFLLDPLSAIMVLTVTGVGLLIHVYSAGYMKGDEGGARYFALLNLFIFFMCWLVLAENLVMLFIGWEGVAFCSWALIGFWFSDEENVRAGDKAFLVNRIGDAGFLIAIFLIFWSQVAAGGGPATFSFSGDIALTAADHLESTIGSAGSLLGLSIPFFICMLLLLGATGKSAQLPLYVWLPDAMAGPTPVSALIHAATMVTAGVYLVIRLHPLFELSAAAMTVVACIGAVTLIVAALFACVEMDFKKILAYSTISQLGYMFLGAGVGAYSASMFHLVTHAFFKALLFLCSGVVLHALGGIGDIRKMGGLHRKLPVTFWTFLVGSLALAGIFPLAGFFSKDEILWYTMSSTGGSSVLFGLAAAGVLLTAFYTFRLLFVAFTGKTRLGDETWRHIHTPGLLETVPMVFLAVLSLGGGLLGVPEMAGESLGVPHVLSEYLYSMGITSPETAVEGTSYKLGVMLLSLSIALAGVVVAYFVYGRGEIVPESDEALSTYRARSFLQNKFYVEETARTLLVRPLRKTADFLWRWIDSLFVDTLLVNGSAIAVRMASWMYSRFQNGRIDRYLFWIYLGVLGFLLLLAV